MAQAVEIARFRDGEPLQHCIEVLNAAGIPHRVSSDAPVFDMMAIGRDRDTSAFIMVHPEAEKVAREALLGHARQNVTEATLADHHFAHFSDEELLDVVKWPLEWGPDDVATAEAMLAQRQVPFSPAIYPESKHVEAERQAYQSTPHPGEPLQPGTVAAKRAVIIAGYLFSFGALSFAIGWGLYFTTAAGRDGQKTYLYDAASRRHGLILMITTVVFTLLMALFFMGFGQRPQRMYLP